MIVCHCRRLTDRDIRAGRLPKPPPGCGGCMPLVREIRAELVRCPLCGQRWPALAGRAFGVECCAECFARPVAELRALALQPREDDE